MHNIDQEKNERAQRGVEAVREALKTIPGAPGVYRMTGGKGEVLYVGKALNLKKRVTSYTHMNRLPERLRLMVSLTVQMEIVITRTEAEALLLEANYIKRMKPRFNILLRDDKSYPWLLLTGNTEFPRVMRQRGKPSKGAEYWGPFASARAVEQTLQLIQRAFLLRSCSDHVFNSRTRPCLLHQIKRCSAPCVDRISAEDYGALVKQTRAFLSGGGQGLQQQLAAEMEAASAAMAYERAALIRDRLRSFSSMTESSVVNPKTIENADVVALWQQAGQSCVQVFLIRGGRNNGHRAFYPSHGEEATTEEILAAFLLQFYDDKPPPEQILLTESLPEAALLEEALSLKRGRKVRLVIPQRGEKKEILDHALLNAREALERRLAEYTGQKKLLEEVAKLFALPGVPRRIEVYDNSHLMGQAPYGVMIVGGEEGFVKRAYRKYAIRGPVAPGDDFGMMREVMQRRFAHLARESLLTDHGEGDDHGNGAENFPAWPDLLLIDGGQGQVRAVREILSELGVHHLPVIGIAKGVDRNAGREWFFVEGKEPFQLPPRDAVLYYLQRLRDEAHRFAVTTHRTGRSKAIRRSALDDVPGIGGVRKKALLAHFGSARAVRNASLEELERVPGIYHETAQAIYGHFRPDWGREQDICLAKQENKGEIE